MTKRSFATAINCMDGRTQLPVIEYIKRRYNVDYVDMITEAGPIGILSQKSKIKETELIKNKVKISVNRHGSKLIAVIGHHDCAGNPVEKDTQIKQIKMSCKVIEQWDFNASIIGMWVADNWEVCLVE